MNVDVPAAQPAAVSRSNTAHGVHDMRGRLAPADWPRIRADEAAQILCALAGDYRLRSIEWHSPRPFSSAALVATNRGPVFIKRHDPRVRTVAMLNEEHRFITHLRANAFPAPRILPLSDGRTALRLCGWSCEVHAAGVGMDTYQQAQSWTPYRSSAHARNAGEVLARLHRAAAGFRAPARRARLLVSGMRAVESVDLVAYIEALVLRRPALAAYLRRRPWRREVAAALGPWHRAWRAVAVPPLRRWTHNDWHGSNLLWSGAGPRAHIVGVMDFGLCAPATPMFDLATAVERSAVPWLEIQAGRGGNANLEQAVALIQGYRREHRLGNSAWTQLLALLPIVHVDFALSEIEYFEAITASRANADLAYEAFLLGHARWFAGAQGRTLLHRLAALRALEDMHGKVTKS